MFNKVKKVFNMVRMSLTIETGEISRQADAAVMVELWRYRGLVASNQ